MTKNNNEEKRFPVKFIGFEKIPQIKPCKFESVNISSKSNCFPDCKKFADEEKTVCKKTPEDFILKNKLDYNRMCLGAKIEEFFAKK